MPVVIQSNLGNLRGSSQLHYFKILRKIISNIAAIKVVKLEDGSTVVTFHVIMNPSAPKNTTSPAQLTKVLTNAVDDGDLAGIEPVVNQTIVVEGRYINGCF